MINDLNDISPAAVGDLVAAFRRLRLVAADQGNSKLDEVVAELQRPIRYLEQRRGLHNRPTRSRNAAARVRHAVEPDPIVESTIVEDPDLLS